MAKRYVKVGKVKLQLVSRGDIGAPLTPARLGWRRLVSPVDLWRQR